MFELSQRVDPAAEFPALAAAIAGLTAPAAGGSAADAGARVRALVTLKRQLEQRLLTELASFDRQGFADGYGFPSTASWLRAVSLLDNRHAAQMVSCARTAAALPLLNAEFEAGRVGAEHLEALTRQTRKVPTDEVCRHDETLRDLSVGAKPSELAVAGKAIAAVWRHDLAEDGQARLREIRRFDFSPTFDGLWHVDGLLPVEVGAELAVLIQPLARPRGAEDERTATQRRADAFAELLDMSLRLAPLPDVAGERPRLTVVVTAGTGRGGSGLGCPGDTVADMLGRDGLHQALIADGTVMAAFTTGSAANVVGSQGSLSPETLARLACEADINVAAVNRGGEVLNLGRSSRFPNLVQRRALVVRDRGCVFPGCDRPPAACIAHHLVFWSQGGRTDLANLALVCHYHHHVIHEDHWSLVRLPPADESPWGGWAATSPRGLQLREFRQPAA